MSGFKKGGVIIIDFGSQYTQLIARKIREQNVFSEILPHEASLATVMAHEPRAIVLSGGPSSVYEKNAPSYDKEILDLDLPYLAFATVCTYWLSIMAAVLSQQVKENMVLPIFQ